MISDSFGIPVIPIRNKNRMKELYEFLANQYPEVDLTFMNYGYAEWNPDEKAMEFLAGKETHRHAIQMYRHVLGDVSLDQRDVLEIGSGRGGGASYLIRTQNPRTMVGMDLSRSAIQLSRKNHKIPKLYFVAGDAETLPFLDESFDVILNIESCHGYDSLSGFLSGVFRLLRPNGYFLLADFRATAILGELRLELYRSGLTLIEEEDISRPALQAMQIEHDRKEGLVKQYAPPELVPLLREFSGLKGSRIYAGLQDGTFQYLRYKLQKKSKTRTITSTFLHWYSQRNVLA